MNGVFLKKQFRPLWKSLFRFMFSRKIDAALKRDNLLQCAHLQLLVFREVFHPKIFITGCWFAERLRTLLPQYHHVNSLLDMGTGTGICAISASYIPSILQIIALDCNPIAVECARANVRLHGKQDSVRALQSDLFNALSTDQRFDCILFNPPFYQGTYQNVSEMALFGGQKLEVIQRFADSAAQYLTSGGFVLVLLSSEGREEEILDIFIRRGYAISIECREERWLERLTLYHLVS